MSFDNGNVIGLDFLASGRCVLELDPEFPRLVVHRKLQNTDVLHRIKTRVEVNGTEVLAIIDTGSYALVSCSAQEAEKLHLQVEELEEPIEVDFIDTTSLVKSVAREVQV